MRIAEYILKYIVLTIFVWMVYGAANLYYGSDTRIVWSLVGFSFVVAILNRPKGERAGAEAKTVLLTILNVAVLIVFLWSLKQLGFGPLEGLVGVFLLAAVVPFYARKGRPWSDKISFGLFFALFNWSLYAFTQFILYV